MHGLSRHLAEIPWANVLGEKAGESLKVILGKLLREYSCHGRVEDFGPSVPHGIFQLNLFLAKSLALRRW